MAGRLGLRTAWLDRVTDQYRPPGRKLDVKPARQRCYRETITNTTVTGLSARRQRPRSTVYRNPDRLSDRPEDAIVRCVAVWPANWQPEASTALEPYLGTDHIVEIWVGDPATSISGTLLDGRIFVADDGRVTAIHDRPDRPDVYQWPLLAGPVLRMTARLQGRRRKIIFEHPSWIPPAR